MFEISIETEFCAAHAIVIGGRREPMHGHNWRLTIAVGGATLDADELLIDFHLLERLVADAIAPFRDRTLNDVPPFDRVNPTAEAVARHVAERVGSGLPDGVTVTAVRVTEAPGCAAVHRPRP